MRSFVPALSLVCMVLSSGSVWADEGEGNSIETMLSAIPEFKDKEPEEKEEGRGAPEAGAYAVYTEACQDAVLALFKPPRKVVKSAPKAQLQLFVAVDAEGYIHSLSKTVVGGLGEAVGINYISSRDKQVLMHHLTRCADQDYFERGIELAIEHDRIRVEPVDISDLYAVEIDFAEDLERANLHV